MSVTKRRLSGLQRHEAHAFQSLRRDTDLVTFRKVQVKRLSVGERDVMWSQFLSSGGRYMKQYE